MFLTKLDHLGYTWTAELRVIPSSGEPGLLEFAFSRAGTGADPERVTWLVSGASLETLAEEGIEGSEEMLLKQLDLALLKAGLGDPSGVE